MRNCNQKSFSESFLKVARKIGDNSTDNFSRFNGMYIAARMCGVEVPPNSRKFYIENVGAELNFPPAKITKNPFEKRHDFSSVEEASEYLKQYGIEAEFSKLKLANLVVDSIEDFIQINDNPDMFRGLVIKKNTNDGIHTFGSVSWKYSYLESKILDCYLSFNEAYDFERHKNTAWRNYFSGHYASASEKYSIYHELGHWLDLQSRPEEYARSNDAFARNEKYVNEIGKRRFGKVSAYAQKSPQEYIAEYIAARMCGLEFPEEVNKEIEYYTPLRLKFPTVNQ